jgi:hypothetical protein
MINVGALNVSLTKHGAHKVATLLRKYDKDQVLGHLEGSEPGVNIESAQAKKTLAANSAGKVPDFWNDARARGSEAIDALVLLAIIVSHHRLIAAMQGAMDKGLFSGRINRGAYLDGKAFTNFAHIIEELAYSTEHSPDHISFDLRKFFRIAGLNTLAAKLLQVKLKTAGWDGTTPIEDAAVDIGLHRALSVSEPEFRGWLATGAVDLGERSEDDAFFFNAEDDGKLGAFKFTPGHNPKKTGTTPIAPSAKGATATLFHNRMQNSLFAKLEAEYGKGCVGTEVSTGAGTAIDIVVKTAKFCWFYEIKTAMTVKGCIRQAIPQLLEYAYWHGTADRVDRLVIVGPRPITKQAEKYLTLLRDTFRLKLYYEQHAV